MEFLTRRPAPKPHDAQLFLATPLMPEDSAAVGRRISGQVLADLSRDSRIIGRRTVPGEGGLPFGVLELRIVDEQPGQVLAGVVAGLGRMGVGRGTQLVSEGEPVELGDREVVVLTVPGPVDPAEAVAAVQELQVALEGVAVLVSTCPAGRSRHLVFEGADAAEILAVLRDGIARHPVLAEAAVRSITPGAAEAEPVVHPGRMAGSVE